MRTLLSPLREAAWLDPRRARVWAAALILASALAAGGLLANTRFGRAPDFAGRPLAPDFSSFWVAARLAAAGMPEAAWSPPLHEQAQRESFAVTAGYAPEYYAFFYPPPFLLLLLPLGLLPYGGAAAAWLVATGAGYVAAVRALLPRRPPWWLACLAYPAFAVNAENGQNGALSAALLGAAALQLEQRPRLAGLCLGVLCYKPQLALLVLPVLLAARRTQALVWAGMTMAGLCGASLLLFGPGAWRAFLHNNAFAGSVLVEGLANYGKMASPFAGLRLLGGSLAVASAVQLVTALGVVTAIWHVARRRPGGRAEMALLAAGSCLVTPFLFDYDLLVLAIPLAWIATEAAQAGWLPWEKLAALAAFLLPAVMRAAGVDAGLPLAPLTVAALLAAVLRRLSVTASAGLPTAASGRLGYA